MNSFVISLLSPKGGVGKSTLATSLVRGIQLAREESELLLIDSDSQGTATDWRSFETDIEYPQVVTISSESMQATVAKLRSIFNYIIIDGKGNLEAEAMVASIKSSDLVIIPSKPSGPDIWSNESLVKILRTYQSVNAGRPVGAFIISMAKYGTRIARDVLEEFNALGLPTMKTGTYNLVGYSEAISNGLTVFDYPRAGPALENFKPIVREVLDILEGKKTLSVPEVSNA